MQRNSCQPEQEHDGNNFVEKLVPLNAPTHDRAVASPMGNRHGENRMQPKLKKATASQIKQHDSNRS